MKLIIEIPEKTYHMIITGQYDYGDMNVIIRNGTPLPKKQEPKTGHWIADVDKWGDIVTTVNGYRCDKCNAFNSDKDNYCPNCGAKMVEPQEISDRNLKMWEDIYAEEKRRERSDKE